MRAYLLLLLAAMLNIAAAQFGDLNDLMADAQAMAEQNGAVSTDYSYVNAGDEFADAFASAQKSANTVAIVVSIIFSLCCIATIVIIVCCCCAAGKAVSDANAQMQAHNQTLLNQQ